MKILVLIVGLIFLLIPKPVLAIVDPLSSPNNKFGIHIADENDISKAADLVNTSKGDWGYTTLVIRETDRDLEKWQGIFDQMRSLHLIPIVRLATRPLGDTWEKPELQDAASWAEFLGKLYWVTKNRYVVLFNEPNHAKEWGNAINPTEYGEILKTFSLTLKSVSDDFFILPAGLDASAPNSQNTMDEVDFLREMIFSHPDAFNYIDGWTSHSYPNPNFSGKVEDKGRGTLRTYLWELEILKSLGQKNNLAVFITETGWAHKEGISDNKSYFSSDSIAAFLLTAAKDIWSDPQIAAVTPFILNYQSYPFLYFSWQKPSKNAFYSFYDAYKSLEKISGRPLLNTAFENFSPNGFLALNSKDNITGPSSKFSKKFITSLFSRLFNL